MTSLIKQDSNSIIYVKIDNLIYYNPHYSKAFTELALEQTNNTKDEDCVITVEDLQNIYHTVMLSR